MEYSVTVSQVADKLELSIESARGIVNRSKIPYIVIPREEYIQKYGAENLKGNKPYLYHTDKANELLSDIMERRAIAKESGQKKKYDPILDIKASRHLYYSMEELKEIFQKSQTYIMRHIEMCNVRRLKPDGDAKVYYRREDVNTKLVDTMIKFCTRREYTIKLHEIKKMLNG